MKLGSNTEEGKLYHQNYFDKDKDFQRKDSHIRLNFIEDNYNFKFKKVLDLGCNVGFFSFGLQNAMAGKVIGVDYDKDAIDYANKIKKEHNINNVEFINEKITLNTIKRLYKENGKFDVINALAVLPWIAKNKTNEKINERGYVDKLLDYISKYSKVAFIELQYYPEPGGCYWLEDDNDCKNYLLKHFKYVYKIITTEGWGYRTIWKCFNDYGEFIKVYENDTSVCYLSENYVFKKVKKNKKNNIKNEVKYLKLLEHYLISPKVIEYNDTELYLSGINGNNLASKSINFNTDEFNNFLKYIDLVCGILKHLNIKHRDIIPDNLIYTISKNLYLIDFEYATDLDSDDKDITKDIGANYNKNGWENESMFKELLNRVKKHEK